MPIQICNACGTSYPDTPAPPSGCLICEDERQFVPRGGQVWTTPAKLAGGHVNAWRRLETDLFEIHTHPGFGIGQRALLLRTPRVTFSGIASRCWTMRPKCWFAPWAVCRRSRSRIRITTRACRIGRAPLAARCTCTLPTPVGSCVLIPRSVIGMAKRWKSCRRDAAAVGRPLSRRHRAALGRWCGRARRDPERRHCAGGGGPRPGLVSLELPEHDAAGRGDGTPHRRHLVAVAVRPDLRGLPGRQVMTGGGRAVQRSAKRYIELSGGAQS